MTRKQWNAQGRQSDDVPTVLRRRAKELLTTGYTEQTVSVLLRAADELQMRRTAAVPGDAEQLAIEACADNRRLRNVLVRIFEQIRARKPIGWPDQVQELAKNTLAAVRPFGEGRRIMAIQIGPDQSRADIEAIVAELLDVHYRGIADAQSQADQEAEPAGCDAPERESQQPPARGVEAASPEDGARRGDGSGSTRGATD